MNRKIRYGLLSFFTGCMLLAFFSAWLLGTTGGARWVISEISSHTGLKIETQGIEGRLWGDLRIEGVRISWSEGVINIGRSRIRWQPLGLLLAAFSVSEISIEKLSIEDNRPEKPTDLKWPAISGLPSHLGGRVDSFDVRDLVYSKPGQPPFTVERLSSRITWQGGILSVHDLSLATRTASLSGKIAAGFRIPSFNTDIVMVSAKPFEKMDRFSLKANLGGGSGEVQMQGPVSITGMSGNEPRIILSGEMGVARKSLILEKLALARTGVRGGMTGQAEIIFVDDRTDLQMSMHIEDFDLSPELSMETHLSGDISVKGSTDAYRGELSLQNHGKGWRTAGISGSFEGNKEGLRIAIQQGSLLDGDISGTLEGEWSKGFSLDGTLRGRRLDPSILDANWKGIINLDLGGKVNLTGQNPEGRFTARLLESRLHGRTLTGAAEAEFRGDDIRLARLFLKGRGFDLSARGNLRERLNFSASVTNVADLVPEAKGSLHSEGWVKRNESRFAGSAKADGRGLSIGDLRIRTIHLAADLSDGKGYPVNVQADIVGFDYRNLALKRLRVKANGTRSRHTVTLDAEAREPFSLHAAAEGSYEEGGWKGQIDILVGRDAVGPFSLRSPAEIRVTSEEIFASPLTMRGGRGEELTLSAALSRSPANGYVKVSLERVSLERLNPWLGDGRLSGTVSGNSDVQWRRGRMARLRGRVSASGALTFDENQISIKDSSLDVSWNESGLRASLGLFLAEGGALEAAVTSSASMSPGVPESGMLNAKWKDLNLVLLRPLLPRDTRASGQSSGNLRAEWKQKEFVALTGSVSGSGAFVSHSQRVEVREVSAKVAWTGGGLKSSVDLELVQGGRFHGIFSASGKPGASFTGRGEIEADWKDFDLVFLQRWLPEEFILKGIVSGHAEGRLLPDKRLVISGKINAAQSSVSYHSKEGLISSDLRKAELTWTWEGERLAGNIALSMTEYGALNGHFSLPIPARIPPALNRTGKIDISLTAKVREEGLLTSIFPGLVRETHGDLDGSLRIGGTPDKPVPEGSLELSNAGAYLPSAGIKIENVLVKGHFERDRIIIDTFHADSGEGKIQGSADFHFEEWRITGYRGSIAGKNFRTVYLPDLEIASSPKLTFEGGPQKISVSGEVRVPELLLTESKAPSLVKPSGDVVIIDKKKEERKTGSLLEIDVRVILGDSVFVKAEGIDAQLKGDIAIAARGADDIRGKGVVNITKGTYKRYGVDLKVDRGRIFFGGGPAENPALDVLATRKYDEVKAGVLVSGNLESPVIKLYSEPSMPDSDILAYIVLGHPLGEDKEQASLLAKAAGVLLSQGESAVLQDQLKRKFGLDVLDVEASGGTASRSMLTVGKYLTPKIFISYGQSLFQSGNVFKLRYNISKRLELESQSGSTESGADLIYKINFR